MVQESTTEVSPSSSTGTFSELCGAIASFSVKHQGIDSADSPLCASAIRVRQQNGLNGRASSVPTSSNSFRDIEIPRQVSPCHCEERKRRSNPCLAQPDSGLLRFARNDVLPYHPSRPTKAGHPVRRDVRITHHRLLLLDHPLEPVIGRRAAPTRWRMMTVARTMTPKTTSPPRRSGRTTACALPRGGSSAGRNSD